MHTRSCSEPLYWRHASCGQQGESGAGQQSHSRQVLTHRLRELQQGPAPGSWHKPASSMSMPSVSRGGEQTLQAHRCSLLIPNHAGLTDSSFAGLLIWQAAMCTPFGPQACRPGGLQLCRAAACPAVTAPRVDQTCAGRLRQRLQPPGGALLEEAARGLGQPAHRPCCRCSSSARGRGWGGWVCSLMRPPRRLRG